MVKNIPANAGDTGSIPGLGRCHMPWRATKPQCASVTEPAFPRACSLQQEKPL